MTSRPLTPSQTVGPFFHDCLLRADFRRDTIAGDARAAQVRVTGRVLDGDGTGVPDAVIEIWQAAGFARVGTDAKGAFAFTTARPAPVPFDATRMQAPHLSLAVFARGLLNHLFTRIYFADESSTAVDPVLQRVPDARRGTLVAYPESGAHLTPAYRFDIVLQGDGETVFFDFVAPSGR